MEDFLAGVNIQHKPSLIDVIELFHALEPEPSLKAPHQGGSGRITSCSRTILHHVAWISCLKSVFLAEGFFVYHVVSTSLPYLRCQILQDQLAESENPKSPDVAWDGNIWSYSTIQYEPEKNGLVGLQREIMRNNVYQIQNEKHIYIYTLHIHSIYLYTWGLLVL